MITHYMVFANSKDKPMLKSTCTLAATRADSEAAMQLEVPSDSTHTNTEMQPEIATTSPAKEGLFPLCQNMQYRVTIITPHLREWG